MLRAIPVFKERLQLNVELTSLGQFIPVPPGWKQRSPAIIRTSRVGFHHSAVTAQALSEIERERTLDRDDVEAVQARGVNSRAEVRRQCAMPGPQLYRYRFPVIGPPWCRRAVDVIFPP